MIEREVEEEKIVVVDLRKRRRSKAQARSRARKRARERTREFKRERERNTSFKLLSLVKKIVKINFKLTFVIELRITLS